MSAHKLPAVQYVTTAKGLRIAHRIIPSAQSPPHAQPPLVMHIHFRANLVFWDPLLLQVLSHHRTLILFDQPGTGRSTGTVPTTYQGWADDLLSLIDALELKEIDLLGFSMGGRAVQMVALSRPGLVRKLILMGTDASAPVPSPDSSTERRWPRGVNPEEPIRLLKTAVSKDEVEHAIRVSFFPPGNKGAEASAKYWQRVREMSKVNGEEDLIGLLGAEESKRQYDTALDWAVPNERNSWKRSKEIEIDVLVMNGDDDLLIATPRSYELMDRLPNAQLTIYPQAGHGFLWQYAELVGKHVNIFLDGVGRNT